MKSKIKERRQEEGGGLQETGRGPGREVGVVMGCEEDQDAEWTWTDSVAPMEALRTPDIQIIDRRRQW